MMEEEEVVEDLKDDDEIEFDQVISSFLSLLYLYYLIFVLAISAD